MKHLLAVIATGVAGLASPAVAAAAEMSVVPAKPCYSSREVVTFVGSGFTPLSAVSVEREDGESVGSLPTDATGAFSGALKLGLKRGRETRTYTATDATDPSLTASVEILVSAVAVILKPMSGAPGRRLRITAKGFTTGRTLWMHVVRAGSKRHVKLGRLMGACRSLTMRRRVLPSNAAVGRYTLQFDTFRKYRAKRPVSVGFTITVSRVFRPAAAGMGWSRLF